MATEYTETEAEPDDVEARVLDALTDGDVYALVVATSLDPLNLRIATNHGVATVRALLTQALKALPPERVPSEG